MGVKKENSQGWDPRAHDRKTSANSTWTSSKISTRNAQRSESGAVRAQHAEVRAEENGAQDKHNQTPITDKTDLSHSEIDQIGARGRELPS